MKLYTSRYQNKSIADTNLVAVGITLGNPRFPLAFTKADHIRLLAPDKSMWGKSHEEFTALYRAKLEEVGVEKIGSILRAISHKNGERDLVLLCFEDVHCADETKNFCHRRVFAEWWEEKTGEKVEELAASGPAPQGKERRGPDLGRDARHQPVEAVLGSGQRGATP